jgi:hypothetical protein
MLVHYFSPPKTPFTNGLPIIMFLHLRRCQNTPKKSMNSCEQFFYAITKKFLLLLLNNRLKIYLQPNVLSIKRNDGFTIITFPNQAP